MIINKEITEFIADKVIASTAIEQFCVDSFGKSILVFIGIDNLNPPNIDSMPCLVIEPVIKNIGSSDSNFDYQIALSLGIKGEEKPTIAGNKVTYDGIYQIEELGNIVVDEIKEQFAKHTNLDTYEISFYTDEINAFPTYSGVIVASMSVPNIIGTDKIEFNN